VTLSKTGGFLHADHFHTRFVHTGLLHIGGTIAPQERTNGSDTTPTVPAHGESSLPRVIEQSLPGTPLPPFGVPHTPRLQVDLGRLVGPPEGATPFMVAGLVRAPATEEGRGSLAVETLTMGTVDLSIIDRPATPYHRPDPPSPTPKEANPNPNGSGSGSPSWISPLGNRIIRRVIRLPTSTRTRPVVGHPSAFRLNGAVSPFPPLGIRR
jgi:hypothetical protein